MDNNFIDLYQKELLNDIQIDSIEYEKVTEDGIYIVYNIEDEKYYETFISNSFILIDLQKYMIKQYQFKKVNDIENFCIDIIDGVTCYYNLRESIKYLKVRHNFDEQQIIEILEIKETMDNMGIDNIDTYLLFFKLIIKNKLQLAADLVPAWFCGKTAVYPAFSYKGDNPYHMFGVNHQMDNVMPLQKREKLALLADVKLKLALERKPFMFDEGTIIQIQHGKVINKYRNNFLNNEENLSNSL